MSAGLDLNETFERIAEPEVRTAPGVWMLHYIGLAGEKPAPQSVSHRPLTNGGIAWNVADMADGYWQATWRTPATRLGRGRMVWFEVRSGAVVKVWRSKPDVVNRVYDAQNERIQRELRGDMR